MSAEAFAYCPRCAKPLAERPIADDGGTVNRRACPDDACGFVQWGNPTPAVGALVEHEGEIILARNRAWPEGWFALVTGYLEAREDPKAAVVREVKEELGLDVVETHLIGNYIFERKNEVMLCYHAVATGHRDAGRGARRVPALRAGRPEAVAAGHRVRGGRLDARARAARSSSSTSRPPRRRSERRERCP